MRLSASVPIRARIGWETILVDSLPSRVRSLPGRERIQSLRRHRGARWLDLHSRRSKSKIRARSSPRLSRWISRSKVLDFRPESVDAGRAPGACFGPCELFQLTGPAAPAGKRCHRGWQRSGHLRGAHCHSRCGQRGRHDFAAFRIVVYFFTDRDQDRATSL